MAKRALDGFSERQIRDGSPDKIAASSAFQREMQLSSDLSCGVFGSGALMNGPANRATDYYASGGRMEARLAAREKYTLASAAFCSPLMLVGLGATLAVLDELDARKATQLTDFELEQLAYNRKAEASLANENSRLKRLNTVKLSRSLELNQKQNENHSTELKARSSKDKEPLTRDKVWQRSIESQRRLKPEHNWIKLKRLIKQRNRLTELMEMLRGKTGVELVASAVAAQIDILDKALKQMGS